MQFRLAEQRDCESRIWHDRFDSDHDAGNPVRLEVRILELDGSFKSLLQLLSRDHRERS
jgi:hypothetical protein